MKHILIINNKASRAKRLSAMLANIDKDHHCCLTDYTEACSSIKKKQPDLVILDIEHKKELEVIDLLYSITSIATAPVIYTTKTNNLNIVKTVCAIQPGPLLTHPLTKTGLYALLKTVFAYNNSKKQLKSARKSLVNKNKLIREVHYRVKNNMQIISSLLYLQSHQTEYEKAKSLFINSQNFVNAMIIAYEKLDKSLNMTELDFEEFILSLIDMLYYTYYNTSRRVKISLHIEKFLLPVDKVIPCAFIINELVANALKHAFPRESAGEIKIDFFNKKGNEYILMVSDNGPGLPRDVDINSLQTLGLRLVRILSEQLGGTYTYINEDGFSFIMTFPLYITQKTEPGIRIFNTPV